MTSWQCNTPVAFLIFNRPDTTAQVFAQIAKAKPRQLLVVADGPRADRPGEVEKCLATRAIIEQVNWPCEVLTNYAEANLGCKQRISSGLDWVFDIVEEAIILEDDCVPELSFFSFCEALLEQYRDDERVMMISGTNYLLQLDIPESYVFSRYFAIWGWATWRRAWRKYDINLTDWPALKTQGQLDYFFAQRYMRKFLGAMFDAVYRQQLDTWDVQWFYSCLFNNGLSIVPKMNLVSNIGITGTHTPACMENPALPTFSLDVEKLVHPQKIFANVLYDEAMFRVRIKTSAWKLARQKIKSARCRLTRFFQAKLQGRDQ